MEDSAIVALYWARDEQAVAETAEKYGGYCQTLSYQILRNTQDAEECVNDTYVRAWHAMPPQKPACLRVFLGKITRNLSLSCYRARHAKRRGGGQLPQILEELEDCGDNGPDRLLERAELARLLDRFLRKLPQRDCCIFLRRYWYMDPVEDIAKRYHLAAGTVKSCLFRTRQKLRDYLEEEGIFV